MGPRPGTTTLTACPACPAPAEVTDRFVLESTDGPVEHVRVRCVARHWFALPTALLSSATRAPAPRDSARVRRG